MFTQYPLTWQVGPSTSPDEVPARYIPAQVPGAVQLDWARTEGWPAPETLTECSAYLWMEDCYWRYQGTAAFAPPGPGEELWFVCGGVDYRFQILAKGEVLHAQEGMFTPVEVNLTGKLAPGDAIEVLVFPAPKSQAEPQNRDQANQSCKPAVSYGWDFHPRLIPLGIWQHTYLEVRPAQHLRAAEVRYHLTDDFTRADLQLAVTRNNTQPAVVRWTLRDPQGSELFTQAQTVTTDTAMLNATVDNPALWWPNGQGEQALYTAEIALLDADGHVVQQLTKRTGFRRVRLVMGEGTWDDAQVEIWPKGPNSAPATLEVNGRRIFAKGSNWVSPNIFPGRLNDDVYRAQLTLAQQAHFNILRCWGGAPVQKEVFDLADELGLLIWQEFPLSCNRYDGTPAYLRVLDAESRAIITRLRQHACVALWCGGNELFNNWSKMTDQDKAARLLNRNCYDLDEDTPFMFTSPRQGMGHGAYSFALGDGREVFNIYPTARKTAYTEFGCGGMAPYEHLKQYLPEDGLVFDAEAKKLQVNPAYTWDTARKAWNFAIISAIKYVPSITTLEEVSHWSQVMQGVAYQFVFEEARRQKPWCGMALNWCFNEPWPTVTNGSLICWPSVPKAGYPNVLAACRPVLASARVPKFSWQAGEEFTAELYLLNDAPHDLPAGRMEAVLVDDAGAATFLLAWDFPTTPANTNLPGPTARIRLPELTGTTFRLVLRVADQAEWGSEYLHVLKSKV